MIYDILDEFKKLYNENGDELILGAYTLKDGLYVKINKDGICEYFEAKTLKNKEKVFLDSLGKEDTKAYNWFKTVDYCSNVIDSSKSYDAPIKSIHNNNYLTLFMKADKFLEVEFSYLRTKLFLTTLSFKKFKKEKDILNKFEDYIKSFSRKKEIVKKYKILKSKFNEIYTKVEELKIKDSHKKKYYIKIFFEEDIRLYKTESEIYLRLKIFNDNKYNKNDGDEICGLSNSNMGLNFKKPFLENRTKACSIPFMLKNTDALMLKKFFDWLKVQPYRNEKKESIDRYLNEENFYIQKKTKNDEAEIVDFDFIPLKNDDVKKDFKLIYVKNHLRIKKDKNIVQDYEIKTLSHLEQKINELFYNNQLVYNYYNDAKDIKVSSYLSKELQSILFITKFSMNNYFRKYHNDDFVSIIKKYGTSCILDAFLNSREFKAKEALNLKFAILQSKGEKIVNIESIVENLELILIGTEGNNAFQKEEFLFLSGQWAYYLLSQSKASNRTFSLAEHYFKIRTIAKLKYALKNDLNKYKHSINIDAKKIRKTISLITSYESDKSRLSDYELDVFLVGFTAENIFYKKIK